MATKTKQDYMADGKTDFLAQQADCLIRPRYGRTQTNWQAQAYWAGFDAAADEKPDTVQVEDALVVEPVVPALTKKAEHHTITVTPIVFEKHTPAPSAVLLHMNWLRNEALSCKDPKRAQRLLDKRGTLASKWAKRVEARG
jgi:hypothetical protein